VTEQSPTPTPTIGQPSPSPSIVRPPSAGALESALAILAIVLALVAGIIGYRIIRGGRGL
jgi:hypothetical protein